MSSSERRINTRVNIRVPLRFRALNNSVVSEQTAESENISRQGIYFLTNCPLKVGTTVEVFLRMPKELTGQMASEIRCTARVVHVQPDSFLSRKKGIGLYIEQYVAAPAPVDRWAN